MAMAVLQAQDLQPWEPKSYDLATGDPAAAMELLRTVVPEGRGKVVYDTSARRFLVVTTPELHQRVAEILRVFDTVPRNVQIQVDIREVAAEHSTTAKVAVSGQGVVRPQGAGFQVKIAPELSQQSSRSDNLNSQLILVASGREAALRMGASMPFVDFLFQYGREFNYIESNIVWRDVGASLWVCPTVVGHGPTISIKLVPEVSYVANGKRQTVRYVKVTTELLVRDGESVTFGGAGDGSGFYERFLTGFSSSGRDQKVTLTLTPRILPIEPAASASPAK